MTRLLILATALVLVTSSVRGQDTNQDRIESILNEGLDVRIVLVADTSGSMAANPKSGGRHTKMSIAKQALSEFVRQLPAQTEVGLIIFKGCQSGWAVPLGKLDRKAVTMAISDLKPRGSTPIYKSLLMGAQELVQSMEKNPYSRNVIVLVTDGEETCNSVADVQKVSDIIAIKMMELNVIGFDLPGQISYLKTIGSQYYQASDHEELRKGLASVQAELSVSGAGAIGGGP